MHRFFKIILGDTLRDGKLDIPRRFARDYGNNLSSSVILKVPTGAKWQVELVKFDSQIWLQNGWQKFMDYYSLAHGSLLVFEYDQKNCNFNVIIFDKSASEIDYPLREDKIESKLEKDFHDPIQETENAASVKTSSHSLPCLKSKETPPLPFPQPHKSMKLENPTPNINPQSVAGKVEDGTDFEAENENMGSQKQRLNGTVSRKRSQFKEAKATAIQRASIKYESKNPFFMSTIQASHIHRDYRMHIPQSFATKYLRNHGNATLNVLDGRTWSVEYKIRRTHGATRTRLFHGWKKFAQDNQLEIGDVCIFELINRTKTAFKVSIFQDTEAENCCRSLSKMQGNRQQLKRELSPKHSSSVPPESIEAAKQLTSSRPFFRLVIKSYHLKSCNVHVPVKFMVKCTKQSRENVMLIVGNRQWPVKMISSTSDGRSKFSAGWLAFARGNSLQVGDICIFELIDGETVLIKVSIFRHVTC